MQNSILPISNDKNFVGTGFCVYYSEEEEKSYLLTCYHVLRDADNEKFEELFVNGKQIEIIEHRNNEYYDMCVIAIHQKIEPLPLTSDIE